MQRASAAASTPRLSHDDDAERSVLGAVFVDASLFPQVRRIVAPADFFAQSHAEIFRAMEALHERVSPIDIITIVDRLATRLEFAGGRAYIASLIDGVPRSSNAPYYARIVGRLAQLRELHALALHIAEFCERGERDPELLDRALSEGARKILAALDGLRESNE